MRESWLFLRMMRISQKILMKDCNIYRKIVILNGICFISDHGVDLLMMKKQKSNMSGELEM